MTLGKYEDMKTQKVQNSQNSMEIGSTLRDVLTEAKEQDRLTCGIYQSAKQLEMNPDGVMLCVLPANVAQDVTLQIHSTLIEAYCWENDIKIVKVDSCDKLSSLLEEPTRPINDNDIAAGRGPSADSHEEDFRCVLVEYPQVQCSEVEEDVMEFCKLTSDLSPLPVVELASD